MTCTECQSERVFAKSKCERCYNRLRHRKNRADHPLVCSGCQEAQPIRVGGGRADTLQSGLCKRCRSVNVCGHPDAPLYRRRMCRDCYTESAYFKRSQCHPGRPNHAQGLCNSCWMASRRLSVYYGMPEAMWAAYSADGGCDLCGALEPGHVKGWRVDHMHGHGCSRRSGRYKDRQGCIGCVRAKLCHRCNQAEGFIRQMVAAGLMGTPTGPLSKLFGPLHDTPFQVWLRERSAQEDASLAA